MWAWWPLQKLPSSERMKKPKIKHLKLTTEKKKANDVFSLYIRTRDMLKEVDSSIPPGYLKCITCDKPYPAFGMGCAQAGHFIPGRHSAVLYDERNCHGQCYNCNINLKGNWVKYEAFMLRTYGPEVIEELKFLDTQNPHYRAIDYVDIQVKFKEKLEGLK